MRSGLRVSKSVAELRLELMLPLLASSSPQTYSALGLPAVGCPILGSSSFRDSGEELWVSCGYNDTVQHSTTEEHATEAWLPLLTCGLCGLVTMWLRMRGWVSATGLSPAPSRHMHGHWSAVVLQQCQVYTGNMNFQDLCPQRAQALGCEPHLFLGRAPK